MRWISFTVFGIPQTKGSAKGFVVGGRAVITNDNKKNAPWAQTVSSMAQQSRIEGCPFDGPVHLTLTFRLPIPKSLPKRRLSYMTKKPDLDKMVRSVKDALKGVFYKDDSQVVGLAAHKVYGQKPGVTVHMQCVEDGFMGDVNYAHEPTKGARG